MRLIFEHYKSRKDLQQLSAVINAQRLGVSKTTMSRWNIRLGISKGKPIEARLERDRKILAHPLFGEYGQPAPCVARKLAALMGCSDTTIQKRRKAAGVESPILYRTRTDTDYRRQETAAEKEITRLITIPWNRPKGIDLHLEYLRENEKEI